MALFGLFGSDKPTTANIQKQVGKLRERYAQPEFRREAMERLLAFGTVEALEGVCQRFAVVAQSPHWDEEEKRWLVDELAERGAPAREAVLKFLFKENHIAFGAKALERLVQKDELVSDLIQALKVRPPEDHRTSQGKTELIACLGDTKDPRVVEALLPYLDDHADDVQCIGMDVVEKLCAGPARRPAEEQALQKLIAIIADDGRSARVVRHAAGVVHRLKVPIDATRPLVPAVVEDYAVRDGLLVSTR